MLSSGFSHFFYISTPWRWHILFHTCHHLPEDLLPARIGDLPSAPLLQLWCASVGQAQHGAKVSLPPAHTGQPNQFWPHQTCSSLAWPLRSPTLADIGACPATSGDRLCSWSHTYPDDHISTFQGAPPGVPYPVYTATATWGDIAWTVPWVLPLVIPAGPETGSACPCVVYTLLIWYCLFLCSPQCGMSVVPPGLPHLVSSASHLCLAAILLAKSALPASTFLWIVLLSGYVVY
jgi:hypothetical protein